MDYLMKEVRIYTDRNSRGEYHWMSCRLFNDKNPKANPSQLPVYYITLDIIINAFLERTDALVSREENGAKWIEVDMSKVPDEGYTMHHLTDVQPEVVALDEYYQPVYRRDYTDTKGTPHPKGSPRIGSNGLPVAPVNQLKVFVQYYECEKIVDGQKVHHWEPVESAYEIVCGPRGVLQRSYRKVKATTTVAEAPVAEEEEPEKPAEKTEEQKAAERAELEAKLAALS